MIIKNLLYVLMVFSVAVPLSGEAASFFFSTGDPDGLIATASQPAGPGSIEIETADDFILAQDTSIDHATFTGLIPNGIALSDINQVGVEIYRVFPQDSLDPPSGNVPTRVNSPSDIAFAARDGSSGASFTVSLLNSQFVVANTVLNGINPAPNQLTGGEGAMVGQEIQVDVNLGSNPFSLAAGRYFIVPQVGLASSNFFWLSAPRPIVAGTGPFTPDLQTWIRDSNLAPDWLRVGTDIVGSSAFNASFSLSGATVPVPAAGWLFSSGLLGLIGMLRGNRRQVG